jgi:hypothetical protein
MMNEKKLITKKEHDVRDPTNTCMYVRMHMYMHIHQEEVEERRSLQKLMGHLL